MYRLSLRYSFSNFITSSQHILCCSCLAPKSRCSTPSEGGPISIHPYPLGGPAIGGLAPSPVVTSSCTHPHPLCSSDIHLTSLIMNTVALTQQTQGVISQASCTMRVQDRSVAAAPSTRMSHSTSVRLSARRSMGNSAFGASRMSARNNSRRVATIVAEGKSSYSTAWHYLHRLYRSKQDLCTYFTGARVS